jgi:signal peptidase I
LTKALWREVISTLLIALVIFLGINATLQNAEVRYTSMMPTLHSGERIFISKLAYKLNHSPQRGDIVIFVPPVSMGSNEDFVKRVIGLPGEAVEMKGNTVYIHTADGTVFPLDEPYVENKEPAGYSYRGGIIPAGQYFVMGDNRTNSNDSRMGWTVPFGDIVGKAWLVTWPPSLWGLAPNHPFAE